MNPGGDEELTRGAPGPGADVPAQTAPPPLPSHVLPPGTRLLDYVIADLLGEGGFGIVYRATDVKLEREVAIKEYLPSSMAARVGGGFDVTVRSPSHKETFTLGLESFTKEAILLAKFDHPALVKVHRTWKENGTAYMVMPYYRGPTLKRVLAERTQPPDESELKSWLRPLLDALSVMHAVHCYHRDIAPDNILLTDSGPVLLDLGAARQVIGDMTHALTVMLKPGFAPIEQYGDIPGMGQGAWTDIFALASVLYVAVTGRRPVPSVERLIDDNLVPASQLAAGRYSAGFLAAIDASLALYPKDRPQSVDALRELLGEPRSPSDGVPALADKTGPARGVAPHRSATVAPTRERMPAPVTTSAATQTMTSATASARAAATTRVAPDIDLATDRPPAQATATVTASPPGRDTDRRRVLVLAAAVCLVVAAGAGYALLGRHAEPPSPTPTEPQAPVPRPSPAPAPVPEPSPAPLPAASPPPAGPPAAALAPTPATAAAPAPSLTPSPPPSHSTAPAPEPAPARAEREPEAARPRAAGPAKPVRRPAPSNPGDATSGTEATRARCSDILQKGSLEPLTPSEAAFLKKECK